MRAIYYILPKAWDSTTDSRKRSQLVQQPLTPKSTMNMTDEEQNHREAFNMLQSKIQWKDDFRKKLNELIEKETNNQLTNEEKRNAVYEVSVYVGLLYLYIFVSQHYFGLVWCYLNEMTCIY